MEVKMKPLFLSFALIPISFLGFLPFTSHQQKIAESRSEAIRFREGGIGFGAFTKARKTNDEVITIQYIDKDGKRVTKEFLTGEQGSKNADDDLKKGCTKEEMAERVKKAINTNLSGVVQATRASFTVSVVATPPNKGIEKFHVTNHTRGKHNQQFIVFPGEPNKKLSQEHYVGRIIMIGGIAGEDDDGNPSTVTVGTQRWEKTWNPSTFSTLEGMVSTIVDELVAHGIQATLENPFSIKIVLDEQVDHGLIYGDTDVGIEQYAGVGIE